MRHFTMTSAAVESSVKSNRTGTPAFVHVANPLRIWVRNAGWKFAACVEANHTRTGDVVRFSQRRNIESPLASSISPRYVVLPLARMRRRVSDRARRSMYEISRPSGPTGGPGGGFDGAGGGTAPPCDVVVDGVWA